MLKCIIIVMTIFVVGCSGGKNIQIEDISDPKKEAESIVNPKLKLPEPLDLAAYKIPTGEYIIYKKDKTYIGIPEELMQNHLELLLVLKNRIYELQQIIIDENKLRE